VGKIAEKAFLTIWHCIFSAELTKTYSFRLFFGNFAHWVWIDTVYYWRLIITIVTLTLTFFKTYISNS